MRKLVWRDVITFSIIDIQTYSIIYIDAVAWSLIGIKENPHLFSLSSIGVLLLIPLKGVTCHKLFGKGKNSYCIPVSSTSNSIAVQNYFSSLTTYHVNITIIGKLNCGFALHICSFDY